MRQERRTAENPPLTVLAKSHHGIHIKYAKYDRFAKMMQRPERRKKEREKLLAIPMNRTTQRKLGN
jgi:hypothetical protein